MESKLTSSPSEKLNEIAPNISDILSAGSPLSRRLAQYWPVVLWSLIGVLLWLQLLNFSGREPIPKLDPSWMAILTKAAVKGWQFGPNINFTYGPLAFLVTGTYTPELFWCRYFYQIAATAFVVILLLRVAWRLPRAQGIAFVALVAISNLLDWETKIFVMTSWETLYFLVIGIIGLTWCWRRRKFTARCHYSRDWNTFHGKRKFDEEHLYALQRIRAWLRIA